MNIRPAFEEEEKKYGSQPKMDPEQTLREIRYLLDQVKKATDGEPADLIYNTYFELHERMVALDEWLTKGGFSPWPASSEPNRFANQRARMSDAQRNKLWEMCGRYNVPFREDDYSLKPNGMVEGWAGGFELESLGPPAKPKTIYVGVEPNGDSHT